ncbi:MAG: tetratricopeptide repeat protein [Planctomycetes bacterium]|nr:tetratricopeptide repeat protein [Planctomycetota bacterium]
MATMLTVRLTVMAGGVAVLVAGMVGCASSSGPRTDVGQTDGTARAQRNQAARLMEAGQYDEAIDLFRALLDETGVEARSLADVRYLLALAHWSRGGRRGETVGSARTLAEDRTEAIQHARAALTTLESIADHPPGDMIQRVGWTLGGYLRIQGLYDEAITLYLRLLDKDTGAPRDRVEVLHGLGKVYFDRGGRRPDSETTAITYRQDLTTAFERQSDALELAGQWEECPPLLLGSIHNSLGLIHVQRLEPDAAVKRYAEADRILGDQAGSDLLVNLILALVDAGRFEEVRTRCAQLEELSGGGGTPQTLAVLGLAALKMGDFSEATQKFDLARLTARQDPQFRDDLTFMAQLAVDAAACAQVTGDYDEAERYLTEAERRLEAGGVDPRTSAVVRANLGRMYLALQRLDDAEVKLEAVLTQLEELQGPAHPDTLLLLLDLGDLARLRGYVVEARQRYEQALEGLIAARGEDHPLVARARLALATLHWDQGRCTEALDQATGAMAILDRRLGPDHVQSVAACLKATLIAAHCKETPEGAEQFATLRHEAATRFGKLREALGPDNLEVLQATASFADIGTRTPAAYAQALQRYELAEEGFVERYGGGVLLLADLRLRKGKLLVRMGRTDQALRVYDRARRAMDRSLEQHPIRADLLGALGDLHAANDELDRARPLWRQALNILTATYGADDARVRQFRAQRRR